MRSSSYIGTRALFRNIFVAHDDLEGARKALVAAIELVQISEAALHGMTVEEPLPQPQGSVISAVWRPKVQAAEYIQSAMIQAGLTATGSRV